MLMAEAPSESTAGQTNSNLVELDGSADDYPLANSDIFPTRIKDRTWGAWDIAALWIGMSIVVTTYAMASGMVAQGLNWWQALSAVILGNLLIFFPLALNGHAGTKYGVPFPVLVRSSFGIHGAHIPAIFRGLVACGWFGIQSWIGGRAIHVAMGKVRSLTDLPLWPQVTPTSTIWGQQYGEWIGFFIFWGVCMWIVWRGIESIRVLEDYGAPFLICAFGGLFLWAWWASGGFFRVLSDGMEQIGAAGGLPVSSWSFWKVFIPSLMAMIGYWATLSLNIPDFTRYVRSQKDQVTGQFCGLNLTMGPFAFLGAFVTAGAFLIFLPQFAGTNLQNFLLENPKYASVIGVEQVTKENLNNTTTNWNDDERINQAKRVSAALARDLLDSVSEQRLLKTADKLGINANTKREILRTLSIDETIKLYDATVSAIQSELTSLEENNRTGTETYRDLERVNSTLTDHSLPFLQAKDKALGLWQPTALLNAFNQPIVVIVVMFALAVATLTTNMAANVVAPANSFSNLAPDAISFRAGGLITGILGILTCPWILYANPNYYLNLWLVGIAGLLAPIGGIMIGDYFVRRRTKLNLEELFKQDGVYRFHGGFNLAGVLTMVISIVFLLPGWIMKFFGYTGPFDASLSMWMKPFAWIYLTNWIFGFLVSLGLYYFLANLIYGQPVEQRNEGTQ
jgi:cytosine/uracil/thiamine/allantoin permease